MFHCQKLLAIHQRPSQLRFFSSKKSASVKILSTSNKSSKRVVPPPTKSALIYKGPLNTFIFNGRLFAGFSIAAHAVVVPLMWNSLILPTEVLALMFSSTALMPLLAVASVSRGYVTRLWIDSTDTASSKDVNLMFETESILLGTPKERVVPVSQLVYRPRWIFGTWRVKTDSWWKTGYSIDLQALKDDPILKRIQDQIVDQK